MSNIDEINGRPMEADGLGKNEGIFHFDIAGSQVNSAEDQQGTQAGPQSLAAALRWAVAGFKVFPLIPDDKRPLRESHGFKDASNDPAFVVHMPWQIDGKPCNIGVATGDGLVVLDVDRKHGKDGFASLAKIGITREKLMGACTFVVKTPLDGFHFYFRSDVAVQSRKDVLPGVDIRGDGGYIVAPPSRYEGKVYEALPVQSDTEAGVPIVDSLPDWSTEVAPFLPEQENGETTPPMERTDATSVPKPLLEIVERARSYLAACPPAISGHGGHDTTMGIASKLVNGFLLDTRQPSSFSPANGTSGANHRGRRRNSGTNLWMRRSMDPLAERSVVGC